MHVYICEYEKQRENIDIFTVISYPFSFLVITSASFNLIKNAQNNEYIYKCRHKLKTRLILAYEHTCIKTNKNRTSDGIENEDIAHLDKYLTTIAESLFLLF